MKIANDVTYTTAAAATAAAATERTFAGHGMKRGRWQMREKIEKKRECFRLLSLELLTHIRVTRPYKGNFRCEINEATVLKQITQKQTINNLFVR